ncbi:MAG: nickel-dependent lactate racemase [Eubacterium aggregans]|uniref:nickel-dependent lactate racemase n=1 Tax=Eubacterium aggregans TaxID=81409 RepID=UPI002B2069F4|nr:nickel-dependent lactate racemase [Eubacterium aggregans]MEA5073488.1 nickel-dependent lactate racemase [Eubacterium aggregans]
MHFSIPYGSTRLSLNLADEQIAGVLESNITDLKAEGSEDDIVVAAMAAPFGGKTLKEMAQGKKDATIIISDHTRPVPSKHIIPFMLKELREGNPDIDITLLVATGFHRLTVKEELVNKLGEKIVAEEKIIVHDSANADANVKIGVLPSGADLIINKVAAEADLLVSEGFIEPHFFAGFSGGRKSVLPGVSDRVTVLGNHCGAFIASDHARTGILEGNPIHKDMKSAAEQANLAYIVNTVIDEDKKVVAAFAGDPFTAHEAGCEFLRGYCKVDAIPADIVITSNGGAPLDQNMYQCVKSMTAAEASAGEDGVIILCAECADGTGGEGFYRALKDCESPAALMEEILQVPQDQTKPDQWEYQIQARILMQHPVIYVSRPEMQQTIEEMKMIYAPDLPTAMAKAKEIKGDNAKFTVIPNGIAVIVSR